MAAHTLTTVSGCEGWQIRLKYTIFKVELITLVVHVSLLFMQIAGEACLSFRVGICMGGKGWWLVWDFLKGIHWKDFVFQVPVCF